MNKLHRISGLLIAFSLFVPALAIAQTTGNSSIDSQVQALLSQISALQEQLKSLIQSAAPTSTPHIWGEEGTATSSQDEASSTPPKGPGNDNGLGNCSGGGAGFNRNLSIGSEGDDVTQLQQTLVSDGFLSASSTTGFFGPLTEHALGAFQEHFGIASSSVGGFFGRLTRDFIEQHCHGWNGDQNGNGEHGPRGEASSTPGVFGPQGSSSLPCTNNEDQGAAADLFVPHAILPFNPCNQGHGRGPGEGSSTVQGPIQGLQLINGGQQGEGDGQQGPNRF